MTYEGRKFTHELCLKQGRQSPYSQEFSKVEETIEEVKKVAENGSKRARGGNKKDGE